MDLLAPVVGNILGIFTSIADFVSGAFSGNWSQALRGLQNIFRNALSGLGNLAVAGFTAILEIETSTWPHLPITRFSHRPLKFFFLMFGSPPLWEHSAPVPQKQSPKMKSTQFGGIGACPFWGSVIAQVPYLRGFQACCHFPKNPIWEYHHVVGQCDLSCLGQSSLSTRPLGRTPLLHGDTVQNVSKILVLGRERIVQRTKK